MRLSQRSQDIHFAKLRCALLQKQQFLQIFKPYIFNLFQIVKNFYPIRREKTKITLNKLGSFFFKKLFASFFTDHAISLYYARCRNRWQLSQNTRGTLRHILERRPSPAPLPPLKKRNSTNYAHSSVYWKQFFSCLIKWHVDIYDLIIRGIHMTLHVRMIFWKNCL